MPEKIEWELIDEPESQARRGHGAHSASRASAQPWRKWKLAAWVVLSSVLLVLAAGLAALLVLSLSIAAIAASGVESLKRHAAGRCGNTWKNMPPSPP